MKVHLIKEASIIKYTRGNAQSIIPFKNWLATLKLANWNVSVDMQLTFNTADALGKGTNRVVFDIGGNNYRIICKYAFGAQEVHLFVLWIGTHSEYTKLCNNNEQYTVNNY